MDEIELKPCPFCGGESKIVDEVYRKIGRPYQVECTQCMAVSPLSREAIAAWNHHRTPKPDDRLREALVEARHNLNHLAAKYGEQEFVAPTICNITAALSTDEGDKE